MPADLRRIQFGAADDIRQDFLSRGMSELPLSGQTFLLGDAENTPRRGFGNSVVSGMSDVSISASDRAASASSSSSMDFRSERRGRTFIFSCLSRAE